MARDRKTGLGDSLLLRRTDRSAEADAPDVPDAEDSQVSRTSEPPQSAETSAGPNRPKRSNSARGQKNNRQQPRDRCTLYIDQPVNRQLDLAARIEGRERSEVVTELLRRHLPKYRIETDD